MSIQKFKNIMYDVSFVVPKNGEGEFAFPDPWCCTVLAMTAEGAILKAKEAFPESGEVSSASCSSRYGAAFYEPKEEWLVL